MTTGNSRLGALVSTARSSLGLTPVELARAMGYRNTNKGVRHLIELEAEGICHPDFWRRLVTVLDIDPEDARKAAEIDAEAAAERIRQARAAQTPHLIVRWFAGFYAAEHLPPSAIDDPVLAEAHAQQVSRERKLRVCLALPSGFRWFDEEGLFSFETAEGPYMRLRRGRPFLFEVTGS